MSALILSPTKRSSLRAAAHALQPVVMIGSEGLTEAVMKEVDRSLAAHELIKVRVLGDDREARIAIYNEICTHLNAAPVQHIGKLLVIWRAGPCLFEQENLRDDDALRRRSAAGPRVVVVRKPSGNPMRKPKPQKVRVLGNERVTAGGLVKRSKARQSSRKKQQLD